MVSESYVPFELAKLLKEKGFDIPCNTYFVEAEKETAKNKFKRKFCHSSVTANRNTYKSEMANHYYFSCPTLQMVVKWLLESRNILVVVDYDYEYTDTSYCYKIYRLGENGKPERVAAYGVSYDKNDNPTTHLIGWRNYERSYSDYGTYEEACEAGIKYILEKYAEE